MDCAPLQKLTVRAALRETYDPACFAIGSLMPEGSHWSLLPNQSLFDVSVVRSGSRFYGVLADADSIIGD